MTIPKSRQFDLFWKLLPMQFAPGWTFKTELPTCDPWWNHTNVCCLLSYASLAWPGGEFYDLTFVTLCWPKLVDHDKVLANSKGSVHQLFKEEGTNKELGPTNGYRYEAGWWSTQLDASENDSVWRKTYESVKTRWSNKIPDAFRETITYFYKEVQPKETRFKNCRWSRQGSQSLYG